jgi:hypothetical protein
MGGRRPCVEEVSEGNELVEGSEEEREGREELMTTSTA